MDVDVARVPLNGAPEHFVQGAAVARRARGHRGGGRRPRLRWRCLRLAVAGGRSWSNLGLRVRRPDGLASLVLGNKLLLRLEELAELGWSDEASLD